MSSSSAAAHLLAAVYAPDHKSSLTDVSATQPLANLFSGLLQEEEKAQAEAASVSGEEQKEIVEWLGKATATPLAQPDQLQSLNSHLLSRTYIVANKRTAADIAVLGVLHPWLAKASHSDRLASPAVTRFLDLLQHDEDVKQTGLVDVVSVEVDNVPQAERSKAPPAAKAKGDKAAAAVIPEGASTTKKEKKPKEKAAAAGAAAGGAGGKGGKGGPAEADSGPKPSNIDLRVGRIVEISKHPDAEKLYLEKIDFGEAEPRTVISGLVDYIPIEEMQNRLLIGVCNLKPAAMRGIKSFAMVLCAVAKEGKGGPGSLEVVSVPEGSQPGDRVYFEGCEAEQPLEQLNPKKKIWEALQPGLITLDNCECAWRDPSDASKVLRIVSSKGVCRSATLAGASLS